MHAIVVISLNVPDPEALPTVLDHLEPPTIPYFDGTVRIAVDPYARTVVDWLEEDDE